MAGNGRQWNARLRPVASEGGNHLAHMCRQLCTVLQGIQFIGVQNAFETRYHHFVEQNRGETQTEAEAERRPTARELRARDERKSSERYLFSSNVYKNISQSLRLSLCTTPATELWDWNLRQFILAIASFAQSLQKSLSDYFWDIFIYFFSAPNDWQLDWKCYPSGCASVWECSGLWAQVCRSQFCTSYVLQIN